MTIGYYWRRSIKKNGYIVNGRMATTTTATIVKIFLGGYTFDDGYDGEQLRVYLPWSDLSHAQFSAEIHRLWCTQQRLKLQKLQLR